ncbi:NAD(P)-dependent oxidoreductase [Microbacterium sp. NEAU-LLC]|uniref:NAD(P)-dependent oxidoreductase n=1 Tax=Microbacterium helvum TaxID=2773713 RepID=A0ABR8NNR4_9MICO|nr:NAD(P)-dependent oxidoreductase [Microbacterium helvum]MBD3942286.1 NAD(P)-dependent oxidoreductase [Microbacterium helvum]
MTTIAILGLGEAGRRYARGLARAGATVRGYDPAHELDDPEVTQSSTFAAALAGADVALSLVTGQAAESVAREALPHLADGAVYADLNTAAPEVKERIAGLAADRGLAMADVAVLAPVVRAGHRTPLLASGPGASAFARRVGPLGVPVEVIDGAAGEAARLRLLRSVFMKGLAALVLEGLGAAHAVGAEDWLRGQMAQELGPDGAALIDRLVEGSVRHAARREHEVRAALAALDDSGQPADMTRATLAWFERLVAEHDPD